MIFTILEFRLSEPPELSIIQTFYHLPPSKRYIFAFTFALVCTFLCIVDVEADYQNRISSKSNVCDEIYIIPTPLLSLLVPIIEVPLLSSLLTHNLTSETYNFLKHSFENFNSPISNVVSRSDHVKIIYIYKYRNINRNHHDRSSPHLIIIIIIIICGDTKETRVFNRVFYCRPREPILPWWS